MLDFSNKAVLITGAGQGIGRATALRFAELHAAVAVADIDGEAAAEVAGIIAKNGGSALAIEADVSQAKQIESMVQECVGRFGRLDVLYNNAASYTRAPAVEMTVDEWELALRTCLTSAFTSSKLALPFMIRQGGGAIINCSSLHAVAAYRHHPSYAAAKAGLVGLTRQLAVEYGPAGIRVNAVLPGAVNTRLLGAGDEAEARKAQLRERIPLRRLGTAEDVAHVVVFLASDMAAFVNGEAILVDGGIAAAGQ